jgi:competence protein ComEC
MKGKCIFFCISALFGIISAIEGIWVLSLFLLYLIILGILKRTPSKWLIVNSIFYLSYFLIGDYTVITNKTNLPPQTSEFQVQFSDEVKINGDRFRAVVKDTNSKEKLILIYKIPSEKEKNLLQHYPLLKYTCPIQGNLVVPSMARNENAFNYREYLKQKHIFWELQVTEWNLSRCLTGQLTFTDKIKKWRIQGITLIEKNFTKDTAPLAAALIFGTRDLLSEEQVSAYQKLGVIHLISISGLHVALLVGMIFYLGIRFGAVREKLSWTLIMTLPLYAVLTGATPSVNRSVLMTMMILFVSQMKFAIKLRSIDGLCLSFLLLAFWNPLVIYNIGFQLSYVVTLSLLLSLSIVSRYPSFVGKMTITSYISQASALPFLLYYFFEIPLLSILANIIFIPLYSVLFLPGLIILFIFHFVSTDVFQLLSVGLSYMIDFSNRIAMWASSMTWTRVVPGRPSVLFLLLYSVSVLVTFYHWEKRKNLLIIILPWIILCTQLFLPNVSPKGEVSFIDVGQGDSILIKLPFNRGNYLIDTGGTISFSTEEWKQKKQNFEVGQDVLVPYLKGKGVATIDLLILTHGDMDHIGGSLSLLKEIKVKKILLPYVSSEKSSAEIELEKLARKKNIGISYVYEGMAWKVDESKFLILAPSKKYSGDKNNGSIVISAYISGVSWLFTGDLGKEGEKLLIKNYPKMTINVLKVGHHGSKNSTSEDFIRHFTPEYSIISVGEKNSFGHPHSEVLKILEASESIILRTDLYGGITYKFNGKGGTFSKVIP